jgi:hypothetical protein
MATEAQINANRLNAQKSTGPVTEKGKNRSRLNGARHNLTGQAFLMTDEDRQAYDRFSDPYIAALKPANPVELQLAHLLAQDNHRLNRIHAIEENTFALGECGKPGNSLDADHPEVHHAGAQARTFAMEGKTFQNISLYEQRITRNIHKNMKMLLEIQDRRKAEEKENARLQALEARTVNLKTRAAGSSPSAEIGFAFSTPKLTLADDPKPTSETPPTSVENAA